MTTAKDCQDFAEECLRWAEAVGDASQRERLLVTARAWISLAGELEKRSDIIAHASYFGDELRRKLD